MTRHRRTSRWLVVLAVVVLLVLMLININNFNVLRFCPGERRGLESEGPDHHRQGNAVNFLEEECEMCDTNLGINADALSDNPLERSLGDETIQLYRHYTGHEPWPEIQLSAADPGMIPSTVHYFWCDHRYFGFHHYLSILSAIRILQPLKMVFHYKRLPPLDHDMYYSWLIELKQSLPYLVLIPLPDKLTTPCDNPGILNDVLDLLQQDGGVFLGSNVIISRLPRDLPTRSFWFAFSQDSQAHQPSQPSQPSKITDKEREQNFHHSNGLEPSQGIIFVKSGFDDSQKTKYLQQIRQALSSSSSSSDSRCSSQEEFIRSPAELTENSPCAFFPDKPDLYPVDIMYSETSFAQLARWLFYGTRRLMHPKTKVGKPIPRIAHIIWFSVDGQPAHLQFYQYLTILSALYVGGFHHVYIHGNAGFRGHWWDDLKKENVTFVHLDLPEFIYQQEVRNPSHMSDVTRYTILYKYGGAYQDSEAMWTQRVPDWLLDYPCIATSDWAAYGDFPDGINPGVLMCKPGAPWLKYNIGAHRFYIEKNFVWNAVLMSYRTFERHPDQLLYYRHLQVMCDFGVCHPSWEPGFRRDIEDRRPTIPFDWQKDTLVVHVTRPDPEQSFISPQNTASRGDMFAEIGRNILTKSGRHHLLKNGVEKYGRDNV